MEVFDEDLTPVDQEQLYWRRFMALFDHHPRAVTEYAEKNNLENIDLQTHRSKIPLRQICDWMFKDYFVLMGWKIVQTP
jgi:hypothetical protein